MLINSLVDWLWFSDILRRQGYTLWQMQFGVDSPEGFHARFISSGKPEIEIITHDQAVHDAILCYGR